MHDRLNLSGHTADRLAALAEPVIVALGTAGLTGAVLAMLALATDALVRQFGRDPL